MTANSLKLSRRWIAILVSLVIAIPVLVWVSVPSLQMQLQNTKRALQHGQLQEARRLVLRAVSHYPKSTQARLMAADVELAGQRPDEALFQLMQVIDDGSPEAIMAIGNAGDLLFQQHRLTEAAERFLRVLAVDSRHLLAKKRLANLYALTGRRLEASRLYLEIVKSGQFDTHELALLGDVDQIFENPEMTEHLKQVRFDDPWQVQAAARWALFKHEATKALGLYRSLLGRSREDLDLQSALGRTLIDAGSDDEFLKWHESLPATADDHPDIWDVRGRYAQMRNEETIAVRCYLEAVRRDPNLRHAHYQLAGLLHHLGDEPNSRLFQRRTDQLHLLSETLGLLHVETQQPQLLERAGKLCTSLGRTWETWGWLHATAALTGQIEFRRQADQLIKTFDAGTPTVLPEGQLALRFDLSQFPLPNWKRQPTIPDRDDHSTGSRWMSAVKFQDMAEKCGVRFTYTNGHKPEVAGLQIWEGPGGGVGVIDYDGDSWPDLYLTQGCAWPPQTNQTESLDCLYRNLGNGQFADVTSVAGLGDERYTHGVSVGDFDSDGFPDMYVCNIGVNRLYRNCGDGTFDEVTAACGLRVEAWSTSGLIADLNGDALPEIYAVTYLSGREPFEHVCHDKERGNAPRTCSPAVFQAQHDFLFWNQGDGSFRDISQEAGIHAPDGKGLGIVAGDFDGSGRMSLFVANDTTANFLFLNQTNRAEMPKFQEQAVLCGCAFDSSGKAQACMGVAADDADGDGLTDLFVTNFYNEYNVLYRQMLGGVFADVSSSSRLKEPSLAKLGFGTQFLDADLDGWPDLVVANGHVDDFRSHGIPYRMQAQFFANTGKGRFSELPASQVGDYFQQELLGRGLARLDWNRDGREDFVVSNLNTPVQVVTNQTSETGHYFSLQLRGVESNRDAIGAIVKLTVGDRNLVKQMTAGDGFQASNQRQLVFGLGTQTSVARIEVRWPSGKEQHFVEIPGDSEMILIEGAGELARLPKP